MGALPGTRYIYIYRYGDDDGDGDGDDDDDDDDELDLPNQGACLRYTMNRNRQMTGRVKDELESPSDGASCPNLYIVLNFWFLLTPNNPKP